MREEGASGESIGRRTLNRGVGYVDSLSFQDEVSAMLAESLREHLRAVPFEPFVIQMNDGRRFEVPHQDFAALSPKGAEFCVYPHAEAGAAIRLSTLLIASIEPLQRSAC